MSAGGWGPLAVRKLRLAREVLEDAKKLYEAGGTARSVVNRAYYAMFYAASALLADLNDLPRKHSGVIGFFDRHFVKTGIFPKEMSKAIHRGFELRQQGDYVQAAELDPEDAKEMLAQAEKFVTAVEERAGKPHSK